MDPSNISVIFITGVSCVGKTTLSRHLAEFLRCDVVYIGDILRSEFPSRTADVEPEEFFPHIQKKINQMCTNLVIIDNFPGDFKQLSIWTRYYPPPILTLHLKSQNALQRKLSRGRADDNHTGIIARYSKFLNFTLPVLEFLKENFYLVEINSDEQPKLLLRRSINIINETLISKNITFHDFTTPIAYERCHESAKALVKTKEPFNSGRDLYLPASIKLDPFETSSHSSYTSVEIGARSCGLVTGVPSTAGFLTHPTTIEPGTRELKLYFTNLTCETVVIDHRSPVAKLTILPTLIPKFVENGYF